MQQTTATQRGRLVASQWNAIRENGHKVYEATVRQLHCEI